MPTSETQAFLSGQGIPVPLASVEAELIRLWGPSAEGIEGSEPEHPNVTRVSLANLVVGGLQADRTEAQRTLETVLTRHPCRAIVMRLSDDPERRVSAEVAAQCSLPLPGLPQVCSEQIVLNVGKPGIDLLPGAVRPLLEPDLPLILWWNGDPGELWSVYRDLAEEASRIIPDLQDPCPPVLVQKMLDPAQCGSELSRDIAWYGVSRWRELVAQFFDGQDAVGSLGRIRQVTVQVAARSQEWPPRAGAWLVAWLAGQLGWKPLERQVKAGTLRATFEGPGGPVEVTIDSTAGPDLEDARIREVGLVVAADPSAPGEGEERFELMRIENTPEVRLETCSSSRCALPRLVHASEWNAARRLAAAFESRRRDAPYEHARPHLFWLLGIAPAQA